MKRFAWLWGALLGAVLSPSLMVGSYMATRQFLIGAPLVHWSLSVLLPALSMIMRQYAGWGGALGCCGVMLWTGQRSSKGIGLGTMGYVLWQFWKAWDSFFIGSVNFQRMVRYLSLATCIPLVLATLLLVFFALLMRSSPPSETKS
jgi:hypothetical protein